MENWSGKREWKGGKEKGGVKKVEWGRESVEKEECRERNVEKGE